MDQEPSTKRRLAAILAADIAGYSRLMGEDEATTVRDLTEIRGQTEARAVPGIDEVPSPPILARISSRSRKVRAIPGSSSPAPNRPRVSRPRSGRPIVASTSSSWRRASPARPSRLSPDDSPSEV